MYKITILTPTYNREYLLPVLYKSLLCQTFKDFEWIIVDDGSVDNTESLIASYIIESKIHITYLKQSNGGKHRAVNHGVRLSNGKYIFIVDSDDYLPDNALERIAYHVIGIEDNSDFAGVCGLKVYESGKEVGDNINFGIIDADSISIREEYGVKGDLAEVWKRSVLISYPFPEFENERFISEAVVWNRIASKYKMRYFYEPIYICEYLPDGLTFSIRRNYRNSPMGTMSFYNENIRRGCSLKVAVISAINYWRYTVCYHNKRPKDLAPIWWTYLLYPIGVLFYCLDIRKERRKA